MTQYPDEKFVENLRNLLELASEASHFYLRWSYFNENRDGRGTSSAFSAWTQQLHEVLPTLQAASHECLVYGSRITDNSFFGQAREASRFLKRRGNVCTVDLHQDLISGCEFFWGQVEDQKPPSYPGEFYFFMTDRSMDWPKLFQYCKNPGFVANLKSASRSSAGYDNAVKHVRADREACLVRFDRTSLYVFAHPIRIRALVRLAATHCRIDNEMGVVFETETARALLVGSLPD